MKTINWKWRILLVLVAPLFMYNVCGKHDDVFNLPDSPNTDEYFTFRIPGYNGNVTNPPDSVTYGFYPGNKNVIVSYTASGLMNTYISYNGPQSVGTYSATYFNVFNTGKYFVGIGTPVQINITSFGPVGQNIVGSYAGPARDSLGSGTYTINGNFKVKNQ